MLLHDWDPIGIVDMHGPPDEYDQYADAIHQMLMDKRVTAKAISAHLLEIVTNQMGLSHISKLEKKSDRTAEMLVRLRAECEPF